MKACHTWDTESCRCSGDFTLESWCNISSFAPWAEHPMAAKSQTAKEGNGGGDDDDDDDDDADLADLSYSLIMRLYGF